VVTYSFEHDGELLVYLKTGLFARWVTIRFSSRSAFHGVRIIEQLMDAVLLKMYFIFCGTPKFINMPTKNHH